VPDQPPRIALVVLNWNGAGDTLECLSSLRQSVAPIHAIVVDNGSTGPDVERIRASGLADVVIETGANLGYAAGNNVGLRYALDSADDFSIVGVLNNDTVVDPYCFGDLAEHLSGVTGTHRALAPTMLYDDDRSRPWFAGGIVERGWPRHLQPLELKEDEKPLRASEWLTGCCIVARAATWRQVGLFDSRYYLIFEDCEWSFRARRHRVELLVATQSIILHKVSRSFDSGPASFLGGFYFMRNGLRFDWSFQRRDIVQFLWDQLLRPTLAEARHMRWKPELAFHWLGALAFAIGQEGCAPDLVTRLAERRATAPTDTVSTTLG
jgi:GT2 family glycosyltransferase